MMKGEEYYLYYSRTIRGERFEDHGMYEFIRFEGSKIHFFSNDLGKDIVITKQEFNRFLIKPTT